MPDNLHYPAAMESLPLGYDLLLEKAIAQSWQECEDILI
jgi:predicted dehydrogenase